jgi:hypothetical protein
MKLPQLFTNVVQEFFDDFESAGSERSGNEWNVTYSMTCGEGQKININFQIWIFESLQVIFRVRAYVYSDEIAKESSAKRYGKSNRRLPIADFLLDGVYTDLKQKEVLEDSSVNFNAGDEILSEFIKGYFAKAISLRSFFLKKDVDWFAALLTYITGSPPYAAGVNVTLNRSI